MTKSKGFFDSFQVEGFEPDKDEKEIVTPDETADEAKDEDEIPPADDADETAQDKKKKVTKKSKKDEVDTDEEVEEDEKPVVEEEAELTFSPMVEALSESGVLELDEKTEYEDSEEGFRKAIEDTVEKKYKARLEKLSDKARKLIEIEEAGGDINEAFETLHAFDYNEIDIEDVSNQKHLVTDYYKALGWEDEDIKDKITSLEDSNTLAKDAKVAHKYLVKQQDKEKVDYEKSIKEKAKLDEDRKSKAVEDLKDTIESITELGGFTLDKKLQQRLFDHITKPVDKKTGETQLMKNRKDTKKQLYAAFLDMVDYNLEDLKKTTATEISKKIKKSLTNFSDKNATKQSGSQVRQPLDSIKIPKGIWDTAREIED